MFFYTIRGFERFLGRFRKNYADVSRFSEGRQFGLCVVAGFGLFMATFDSDRLKLSALRGSRRG